MPAEAVVVEREDVRVLFRRTDDEQASITRAWAELESAVGSLRGRRFYGVFDPATKEYRACVQRQEGDDADALGLEEGTIAGGRYARERLEGEPPAIYGLIKPTMERLAQRPGRDPSRPEVELYRRHDVIDLLVPIL